VAVTLGFTSGLTLLDDVALFDRIADRIAKEHDDIDRHTAARVLDQAIIFVAVAGRHPDLPLSPSGLVDKGWDTFFLYSIDYHAFCQRVCGRFIHHTPNDGLPVNATAVSPAETAELIRRDGYRVFDELWFGPRASKANCTNCYVGTHEGDEGP
jgi:hypothetical protein